MHTKSLLLRAWVRNNILVYFIGLAVLHPQIAHGITGPHGRDLTVPQLIMHTVSLLVFAAMLAWAQNKALMIRFPERKQWDDWFLFMLLPLPFWLGYYTLYIPFDVVFMLLAVGAINAFALRRYVREPGKWAGQIMLSMAAGAVAGSAVGIGLYFAFLNKLQGMRADHAIWFALTTPASVTSALLTRRFLDRQIGEA